MDTFKRRKIVKNKGVKGKGKGEGFREKFSRFAVGDTGRIDVSLCCSAERLGDVGSIGRLFNPRRDGRGRVYERVSQGNTPVVFSARSRVLSFLARAGGDGASGVTQDLAKQHVVVETCGKNLEVNLVAVNNTVLYRQPTLLPELMDL